MLQQINIAAQGKPQNEQTNCNKKHYSDAHHAQIPIMLAARTYHLSYDLLIMLHELPYHYTFK
ncbi:Uncharacterised protein [Chlamydia trachomatis]|nr:Uncharacterised protein [Chlamydia trachomatis]